MNTIETSKLLTLASLVDNRAVSPELVQVWQGLLDDISYADAIEALKEHYRTSTAWLMPATIRDLTTRTAIERRRAPEREKRVRREWMAERGIDWVRYEAGDPHMVQVARSAARGDDTAPTGITDGSAVAS